jgi:hypothetical protein
LISNCTMHDTSWPAARVVFTLLFLQLGACGGAYAVKVRAAVSAINCAMHEWLTTSVSQPPLALYPAGHCALCPHTVTGVFCSPANRKGTRIDGKLMFPATRSSLKSSHVGSPAAPPSSHRDSNCSRSMMLVKPVGHLDRTTQHNTTRRLALHIRQSTSLRDTVQHSGCLSYCAVQHNIIIMRETSTSGVVLCTDNADQEAGTRLSSS